MSVMTAVVALVRRAGGVALDAVLPPQCLSCGRLVDATGTLCAACWTKITWLAPPLCSCCGRPFEFDPRPRGDDEALLCGSCVREAPDFARARAVFVYDEASRGLVLGFKHADRTHGAPAYGRWLARAGAELLAEADIVAPVPLHWTRLAMRRFNQAALLAGTAAAESGRQCIPDLLVRSRRTPQQGEKNRTERARNVRRAFAVHPRHAAAVAGRRVLVVDDVFTTGATIGECTRTLLGAGAAAVDVLTLARVVKPEV